MGKQHDPLPPTIAGYCCGCTKQSRKDTANDTQPVVQRCFGDRRQGGGAKTNRPTTSCGEQDTVLPAAVVATAAASCCCCARAHHRKSWYICGSICPGFAAQRGEIRAGSERVRATTTGTTTSECQRQTNSETAIPTEMEVYTALLFVCCTCGTSCVHPVTAVAHLRVGLLSWIAVSSPGVGTLAWQAGLQPGV